MTMIGPHFGLSRDYDDFLIWGSGGLFGLLSFLFYDNLNVRLYLAQELMKIIAKSRLEYRIPNLLWLLHIIPINKEGKKLFTKSKKIVNEIGSFSTDAFWNPPFLYAEEEWHEKFLIRKDPFPDYSEFIRLIKSKKSIDKNKRIQIACCLLTSNFVNNEMIEKIILK